eukprot:227862-Prymnesium_polylepis.1
MSACAWQLARLLACCCACANGASSPSYTPPPQSFGGVLGPAAVRACVSPPSSRPWLASGVPSL